VLSSQKSGAERKKAVVIAKAKRNRFFVSIFFPVLQNREVTRSNPVVAASFIR